MSTVRASADWLREPTLQRRSVLLVLGAFVLVWAVLVAYQYAKWNRQMSGDPSDQPFHRFGDALLSSLNAIEDEREAVAALAATERWLNVRRRDLGRLPGRVQFELRDRQGRLLYGRIDVDRGPHLHYRRGGPRWQLRVAEPTRSAYDFITYNLPFIGEYLLLALPFVLLPVWLSVRHGLKPLQQLATAIGGRADDDLSPLRIAPRHRELKPLAAALDHLLAQLRSKRDRERMFVQDAAHEIRTPLAVVMAQAHVMAHAVGERDRGAAHALLSQAIARASHVAQQLLLLATLDHSAPAPRPRVDVAQATRELLAQLAPQAMARRIELSLQAPDTLWAEVEAPAFQSIVTNLVDNGIRYGRQDGTVLVCLRADDERLTIQVRDDGPGIPAEERSLVFERFYRAAGQERPGSGLGLAIVRQAAARMGGQVFVGDGLAGRGVGLNVTLPIPGFQPG